MPRNVRLFEWLSYLSLALALVSLPFQPDLLPPLASLHPESAVRLGLIIASIGVALFLLLMIYLIYSAARRRKNWARWILLLLLLAVMPWGIVHDLEIFHEHAFLVAFKMMNLMINVAALYFVFTGDAVAWFAAAKPIAIKREHDAVQTRLSMKILRDARRLLEGWNMNERQLFGVVVRSFGLMAILYGLYSAFYTVIDAAGMLTATRTPTATHLLFCLFEIFVGLILMSAADWIVRCVYRDEPLAPSVSAPEDPS